MRTIEAVNGFPEATGEIRARWMPATFPELMMAPAPAVVGHTNGSSEMRAPPYLDPVEPGRRHGRLWVQVILRGDRIGGIHRAATDALGLFPRSTLWESTHVKDLTAYLTPIATTC
ncbi:hypothetical protein NDU88_006809 [Pleurodeles waltl]|uniref:Uncharacterized protein n=1 Tax=Pleurodeles waltl TaxID=8319 RepID=A0AAV7RR69_PLEWA|nr:hypothetical protein NDU88_006809 [Pleurodeles waltl]